jgi:diguanylate cyclase (GGDEF)-like protein
MSIDNNKQKILVVDDSTENIELLYTMLQNKYQVLFSTSGSKAIILAENAQPDIILLDVLMPEMDGYEVIIALKENEKTRDIPVIFITAKTEKSDLLKGFKLGSVDYIGKPFFEEEIKVRIKTQLQNRLLIKQLEQANKQLEEISLLDALTGIGNRRYFDQFLAQMMALANRENKPLSLLMIDVDYFKHYNDLYGHLAGDKCLQQIANTLADMTHRGGDLAARYGGEEFVLVLSDTEHDSAKKMANDFRLALEGLQIPHAKSAVSDYVTVSIGFTTLKGKDKISMEDLIKDADKALYQAKENGRNQIA